MVALQGKALLLAISLMGSIITKFQENSARIHTTRSNEDLERIAIGVLEELKKLFITGVPEMGIPVLDPLQLDALPLDLNIPGIVNTNLHFADAILSGLSNYNVSDIKFIIDEDDIFPLDCKLELTFNNLGFVSNYGIAGYLGETELSGDGVFSIELTTFKIGLHIATGTYCNMIVLKKFELSLFLKEANVFITDLMKDNAISSEISKTLSDLLPMLVSDVEWNALIEPEIKKTINQLLAYLLFTVPDTV